MKRTDIPVAKRMESYLISKGYKRINNLIELSRSKKEYYKSNKLIYFYIGENFCGIDFEYIWSSCPVFIIDKGDEEYQTYHESIFYGHLEELFSLNKRYFLQEQITD